ncbi:pantetheine-phosphate adenylyltransferase [bacterium]|nr:pantetheine-phosphate adenylyltransferase [bacterium]
MTQEPSKRTAVYAGSFDPITMGHVDVLQKGARVFDRIVLLVAENSQKKCLFSAEKRRTLAMESIKSLNLPCEVEVDVYSGLLADYCKSKNISFLLRGLRAISDYENEMQAATMNRKLLAGLETFLVMADETHFFLSSSLVKEVAEHGAPLDGLVPTPVAKAFQAMHL